MTFPSNIEVGIVLLSYFFDGDHGRPAFLACCSALQMAASVTVLVRLSRYESNPPHHIPPHLRVS